MKLYTGNHGALGWWKKLVGFFVRERVVYVPCSVADPTMPMEALNRRLSDLVNSHHWDLFEEVLMEMHDRKTKELVQCDTEQKFHYVRGSIAMLNMLLTFKAIRKSLDQ